MTVFLMLLSSVGSLIAAVVALVFYDVSLTFALGIYLVAAIVPVALILAGVYVHMLITDNAQPTQVADTARSR